MKFTAGELLKAIATVDPDNYTATVNGAGVDCRGFTEALIVLEIGTATTGTLDAKVQDSADNVTFADVTGATFSQKGTGDDDTTFVGSLNVEKLKRFIRVVLTLATTPDFDASVLVVLIAKEVAPVTQVNTSAFTL